MTESISYSFNVTAFIDLILIDNSKVIKYALRAYLKTKYSCTISTKSKWKQDGQKQERTRRACHSE